MANHKRTISAVANVCPTETQLLFRLSKCTAGSSNCNGHIFADMAAQHSSPPRADKGDG